MSRWLKITAALLLGMVALSTAQPERSRIVEGNKLFTEEKFDEALNKYRDAQVQDPESPILKFNIGDALYKKKKFKEALKEYESSLNSDDVMMQAQSYYNMGNALYRMGKLPESILAYKKSLELNPDDEDAKYNLEFVRKQLKDQANKQKQNPQQQQKQQQQKQQQQQGQDQQDKQKQKQDQQQQQQQQQDEQQQKEQQQQQKQQQMQQQDISKEDAKRILEALKESKDDLKKLHRQKIRGRAKVLKDW